MKIDRKVYQGGKEEALRRLNFCLTMFVKSGRKVEKVFKECPVESCSMEEIVGAMVAAEQVLKEDLK